MIDARSSTSDVMLRRETTTERVDGEAKGKVLENVPEFSRKWVHRSASIRKRSLSRIN
jgi:hypothetical protein